MFSKISVVALTLLTAFAGISQCAPLDVYKPQLTSPIANQMLNAGDPLNVTWDTSNPPKQITNREGTLYLWNNGVLEYQTPLATGFDLLTGSVEITVPNKPTGCVYQLVLIGDSGNNGPTFCIQN